jgi:hypothetical protein
MYQGIKRAVHLVNSDKDLAADHHRHRGRLRPRR